MRRRAVQDNLLIALYLAMMVLAVSCDEVQRHDTLSFFFDGVPPLDPNLVEVDGQTRRLGALDPNEADGTKQTVSGSTHEPRKDCTNCHERATGSLFNRERKLIAPIPKLCYDCHSKDTTPGKSPIYATTVHGPVAIGQCLLCHNPHRSKHEALLLKAQPDLCYDCHDKGDIKTIRGHATLLGSRCSDCHEPHASTEQSLLKLGWKERKQ